MLSGIPQRTCQTPYCSQFHWEGRGSILLLSWPFIFSFQEKKAFSVLHSQPGDPHLSVGPYLPSGLFLWDRIHSSNSYLASSVQPKEWEFCLSNQLCSLHPVSWLRGTNTDIGILLELKYVAEKARNEKD